MPIDVFEFGPERWHRSFFGYLNVFCPGLRQIWAIGIVGWMENPYRPSLSRFMTLLPGDVVSTGTPAGVGMVHKPPVYLEAGDIVEYGIEGLGEARQRIIAGEAP